MKANIDKLFETGIMCGGCKATGVKLEWRKGELVPVEPKQPCPTCNGSGWAK